MRRRREHFGGDAVGGEVGLDELGDGALVGDEVDHAEEFRADQGLGEERGERRDAVDDDHGDVEESGFDGGGAAGDDGGVGGGEGVVGLVGDDAQRELSRASLRGGWRAVSLPPVRRRRRRTARVARRCGCAGDAGAAPAGAGEARADQRPGRTAMSGSSGWRWVSGAERGAIVRRLDVTDERMADEFGGNACVGIKLFFKREKCRGPSAKRRRTIRTRQGRHAQNCGQM